MPCTECNHPLVYDHEDQYLYCPRGCGLPVANQDEIRETVENIQENVLNATNILVLLEEFGAPQIIGELVRQANHAAFNFTQENRLNYTAFVYPALLIQRVYQVTDLFTDDIEYEPGGREELEDRVTDVLNKCRRHESTGSVLRCKNNRVSTRGWANTDGKRSGVP